MLRPPPLWAASYEPGVPALPAATVTRLDLVLAEAAATAPSAVALSHFGRLWRYAELERQVADLAERLAALPGWHAGSLVATDLPNNPALVVTVLGAFRAGGGVLPWPAGDPPAGADLAALAPALAMVAERRAAAWARAAEASATPLVVVDPASQLGPGLRLLRRLTQRPRRAGPGQRWGRWLARPGPGGPEDAGSAGAEPASPALRRAAAPDLGHRQLVAGAAMAAAWLADTELAEESWLPLVPLDEPLGLTAALGAALLWRGRLLLVPRRDGRAALEAWRWARPTYVVADAAGLEAIGREGGVADLEPAGTRAFLVGGAAQPAAVRRFTEATGLRPCVGLAPPEAAGLMTLNTVNGRANGIGLPLPGVDARVVAADGRRVMSGEAGVLELSGPNGPAGWIRTDLLVRQDLGGWLELAGWPGATVAAPRGQAQPVRP